ncbi:MAG TPA: DUF6457 domain-containing protein [Gaiellaceae bacterium]
MHDWLDAAADAIAAAAGVPREQLELSADEISQLLDLAGLAAHESGARTNAPLLSYIVGRAAAASGKSVAELAAALSPGAE